MNIEVSVPHGTLLPALIKVVNKTTGPVIEFGGGLFSTPFLHGACYETRRPLYTIESDKAFYNWLKPFESDYHKVVFVENWDDPSLLKLYASFHWSVALIDHHPGWRRRQEIKRVASCTDYVVAHDSQPRSEGTYKYSRIYRLFKYRREFGREKPLTMVFSNIDDLLTL